jgi:hypothetical protein
VPLRNSVGTVSQSSAARLPTGIVGSTLIAALALWVFAEVFGVFVGASAAGAPFGTGVWLHALAVLVVTLTFFGIAVALVLNRPSIVTWSFYLLACGYSVVALGYVPVHVRSPLGNAHAVAASLALALGVWGGGMFSSRFPDGLTNALGRRYERLLIPAAIIVAVPFYLQSVATEPNFRLWVRTYQFLLLAVTVATIGVVRSRFSDASEVERPRIRWVVAGSSFGLSGLACDFALHLLRVPGFNGSAFDALLRMLAVAIPISVAYAVLRYRVIDVRFAISRALIYGGLTSSLVATFSLIEWIVGKELSATRLAQVFELAFAIAMGFWFNAVHARAESIVERTFFARRHQALNHLALVAKAMPHAASLDAIDAFVLDEPLRVFGLASGAVFRRRDDEAFVRVADVGWPHGSTVSLASDDPLLAYLSAQLGPLNLERLGWSAPRLPPGPARPVLAVPIAARNEVLAAILYGAHTSGEAFDAEEQRALGDLAASAAAAYDHLEAEAMHGENARLRALLEQPVRS